MRQMINFCSLSDFLRENSYQMFFFGGFFISLHNGDNIVITSNWEAREVRRDFCIEFHDYKKLIMFEFKKSMTDENLEGDAAAALGHLTKNNHYCALREYTILMIGASFCGKTMSDLHYKNINH